MAINEEFLAIGEEPRDPFVAALHVYTPDVVLDQWCLAIDERAGVRFVSVASSNHASGCVEMHSDDRAVSVRVDLE